MAKSITPDIFNVTLDYAFFDPNYAFENMEPILYREEPKNSSPEKKETCSYWKDVFHFMEAALSNGIILDISSEDIPESSLYDSSYYGEALQSLNTELAKAEEVLKQFDNWTGTPVDIISPYGDITWGENIFAPEDDITFEVPVKIYRKDSDYVIKANMPWIKMGEFSDVPVDSNLNLKSVLAALPLRINSRQAKVSFVNGELKLKVPEAAEK